MSNIDKRALREAADGVLQKYGSEWFETGSQLCTVHKSKIELIAAANPATVLALLDELEAAEKRIAELEAREAEPVAYIGKIMLEDLTDGARSCGRVWADATDRMSGEDRIPLYTAPPAPVSVPAAMEMDDDFDSAFEHGKAVGWNAYLAAMLQGADGTLTNEGTMPVNQLKPVADLYGLTSPTGGETSFTFDAVEARDFIDGGWSCQEYVELGRFQEAMLQNGNSPAQSDCCPDQNYIAPAQDGNSPVIADGWVACSERMPDIGTEIFYFCQNDGLRDCGIVSSSNFSGKGDAELYVHAEGYDLRFGVDITHWMPLPATPNSGD